MNSALALGLALVLALLEPPPPSPAPSAAATPEVVVETSFGAFTIHLLPELAPKHVAHFLKTAKAKGFDGTTFHRIIAGGIIQGGDPFSKDPKRKAEYGTGGLGLLKAETSDRPMKRGLVAAVRRPKDMNSAGNQFFVVVTDQPSLTGQYTIFGEVVSGLDVVEKISLAPVEGDRARERIEMKVTLGAPAEAPQP